MSDSVALWPDRLLYPWDFPGKSTGVGCHCLLHVVVQLPADALGKCQFVVDTSNTPQRAEIPVLWSGKNAGGGKRVP